MNIKTLLFSLVFIGISAQLNANSNDTIPHDIIAGLQCRNLTPSFVSGRISDFAVNPNNHSEYYVATASSNIWKTNNNGTTFKPVFEQYGAYSIGSLAMDPKNSNIVWAGTGENNHQRALGYGNGVYKTIDGGKSWVNKGLKNAMQIGMIAIHPEHTNIVYVAAEGSVWGPNEERGLYKTEDGGETWDKVLHISENTGVNNVLIDIENPSILYVTTEQRRRRTQTRIGGGPESSVQKSTDGGETWRKIEKGIPSVDKGGIGIAQSPVNPNILYTIVEAASGKGGFFKSTDKGESWNKMSDHTSSGQYYTEIYCDPLNPDRVISVETFTHETLDGGKTWSRLGQKKRHVDDHALWIDPTNTEHILVGGDGGIYETYDNGDNFIHKSNLPITQFYRVNVDNSYPFYWIYGGTQDNSSLGAPNQSLYSDGVSRGEWVVTLGGDGFWQAIDPRDPNIVYSEYQYGNLFRHDKKSGENTSIKPREKEGEDYYKWNWNTPMILSSHNPDRLYIAANKVFRSDDQGQSWKVISDDLTAKIDRNNWPVMDRYWSVDAVAKDVSTSLYGTIIAMAESKLKEGLLYIGTDDGLIQMTEDNGANWTKTESFKGVPKYTYISDIMPSRFDENIVYASFDNIKHNDFKPYILKSSDKGKTWTSISSNLPNQGTVHTIEQDVVDPNILFVGTEFGAFFTVDEGETWIPLKNGLPTIAIKDMVIQERENDLVMASFGRGFYILDDISLLRNVRTEDLNVDAKIFDIKDALLYHPKSRGGYGSGAAVYHSKNPKFGATFTYFLKDVTKSLKAKRKELEKDLIKDKQPIPTPTLAELRKEKEEITPYLLFEIKDENGNLIRKLTKKPAKGIQRINWNLRQANNSPQTSAKDFFDPMSLGGSDIIINEGNYSVSMSLVSPNEKKTLVDNKPFKVVSLNLTSIPAKDPKSLLSFQGDMRDLLEVVNGSRLLCNNLLKHVLILKQSAHRAKGGSVELNKKISIIEQELRDLVWNFNGEKPKASPEERIPATPSVMNRLNSIAYGNRRSFSDVTITQKEQFELLKKLFPPMLKSIEMIKQTSIPEIEVELEKIGAPWTPGRLPEWKFD